jgi:hypothetical protein
VHVDKVVYRVVYRVDVEHRSKQALVDTEATNSPSPTWTARSSPRTSGTPAPA